MRIAKPLLLALLLSLFPQAVAAQGAEDAIQTAAWERSMRSIDRLLLAEKFERAKKEAGRLLAEMCDGIAAGPGAASYLSTAVLLRAIAEAGLGNERDARWDHAVAGTLRAEFLDMSFAAYGEEVSRVLGSAPAALPEAGDGDDAPAGAEAEGPVTPPKAIKTPKPKYPVAKVHRCIHAPVVVTAVVGTDGLPSLPRLLSQQYPVLGFAALDVLRDWRFEPARRNGKAVAVFYTLTVNYKIPRCR